MSLKEEFIHNLEINLEELEAIWSYIGYENDERSRRSRQTLDRLQRTMLDIIQEENRIRIDLESQIDIKKREIAEGCQMLGLAAFFPPRGRTSYQLVKILDDKSIDLEVIKTDRRQRYGQLRDQVIDFCGKLDIADPRSVLDSFVTNGNKEMAASQNVTESDIPILMEADLDRLAEKVRELSTTYAQLEEQFASLREAILRIAADIDYSPAHRQDVVIGVVASEEESPAMTEDELKFESTVLSKSSDVVLSSFTLTPRTLDRLQKFQRRLISRKAALTSRCEELRAQLSGLWKRLGIPEEERETFLEAHTGYRPVQLADLETEVGRCQDLKWERINVYLSNLRQEANQLYAKCFIDRRVDLDSDMSRDAVDKLEVEIDRLHKVYADNSALYTAVQTYQSLWELYVETEAKMKDPAILSNRGGILLKTDKERKRLLKELPKVEAEVTSAVVAYEKSTRTEFLLAGGRKFPQHVAALWSNFKQSKDGNKYKRPKSSVRGEDSVASIHGSPSRSIKS